MACSFLRAHPLQNIQRKTPLSSARPIQSYAQSSFSHLKILSFGNHRRLQHNHPGGLACSQLHSGFGFPLESACGARAAMLLQPRPVPGAQGHCQLLWPAIAGAPLYRLWGPVPTGPAEILACISARVGPVGKKRGVSPFFPFKSPSPNFHALWKDLAPPANLFLYPG